MHFDDEAVGAGGDPRHGHRLDVFPVSGAVRGIDEDGQVRQLLDHRDRAEVEREPGGRLERPDAALAEDDVGIAAGQHVLGGQEPLLDRR